MQGVKDQLYFIFKRIKNILFNFWLKNDESFESIFLPEFTCLDRKEQMDWFSSNVDLGH